MKNQKYNNHSSFRHLPVKRAFPTLALTVVALIAASRVASAQTSLFNYDFESDDGIATGSLNGQSSWTLPAANYSISPVVTTGPGGSINTSQVITGGSGTSGSVNSTLFSAGSLDSDSIVTLSFDVYTANNFGTAMFGMGNTPSTYANKGDSESPTFGAWTSGSKEALAFYQGLTSTGEPILASATPNGSAFDLTLNQWYTIQSTWDLAAGTATLSYEDLTTGDTSFTSLYFGSSTTIALEGTGASDPVSAWNSVYLRLSASSTPTYLDNLQATVSSVPEPTTSALSLTGLGFILVWAFRRRGGQSCRGSQLAN